MCRNIKTLFNFDPPSTDEEIRAASVQFVRKLSGFTAPSKANEAAFDEVAAVARRLIDSPQIPISPGRTQNAWEETSAAVAVPYAELQVALPHEPVVNADDTGHRPRRQTMAVDVRGPHVRALPHLLARAASTCCRRSWESRSPASSA